MKEFLHDAEYVVPRVSSDESTFAVVRAKVCSVELQQCEAFLEYLRAAVTAWVSGTAEGRSAWVGSSEDLNIGDLAASGFPPALVAELEAHGISCMTVDVYGARESGPWSFDTVLADGVEAEKEVA